MRHKASAAVFLIVLSMISLHAMVELAEEVSGYTSRDPISIRQNSHFNSAHGVVGGSGTPSDPYIIEGWEIDSSTKVGISIMDTDAHFIIRDVLITSDTLSQEGIYLKESANGRIERATLVGNLKGIYMYVSDNITVSDCNISFNMGGIKITDSSRVDMTGNRVVSNEGSAFHLSGTDITVARNNVSLNDLGITFSSSVNVTIRGNDIISSGDGITYFGSRNATVADNFLSGGMIRACRSENSTIVNNTISRSSNQFHYGIRLDDSTNQTLRNNTMTESSIQIWDKAPEHWNTHTIDPSNTVNGKPVYYWKNVDGGTVPSGAGEVIIANCTDVRVEGQRIENGTAGILVGYSSRVVVANNTLLGNTRGILLSHTDNTAVTGNSVSHNHNGILLAFSDHNTVSDNDASMNSEAIELYQSAGNEIVRNSIWNNTGGIRLAGSGNTNTVYHNSLNNLRQVADLGVSNSWDNGYPSGGNYWVDFTGIDEKSGPNQDQPGSDGIGDTSYEWTVQGASGDGYPLMDPIVPVPNGPPSCNISSPVTGSSVQGEFRFSGSASDPDGGIVRVEVSTDGDNWTTVGEWTETQRTYWSYEWDTTAHPNGEYVVYARGYDGKLYSDTVSVYVTVHNVPHQRSVFEEAWFWMAIIVIVTVLTAAIVLKRMKKHRKKPPW